jgi:hypothetical protein
MRKRSKLPRNVEVFGSGALSMVCACVCGVSAFVAGAAFGQQQAVTFGDLNGAVPSRFCGRSGLPLPEATKVRCSKPALFDRLICNCHQYSIIMTSPSRIALYGMLFSLQYAISLSISAESGWSELQCGMNAQSTNPSPSHMSSFSSG